MSYHSEFWVAAAAVAPVLAVANTVALVQAIDSLLGRRRADLSTPPTPGTRRWGRRERSFLGHAYWQSLLGFILDLVGLFVALASLAFESDFVPPVAVVVGLVLALVLIVTQIFSAADAKLAALEAVSRKPR